MENMDLKARGSSLKSLMGAMDDDEMRRIPKVDIIISGGTIGNIQDDGDGDSEISDDNDMNPPDMDGGSAFDRLIKNKKRENMGFE